MLPFENMSGDKENEYFSDGLAEEIINALTRIPGLKVIARTSAFAFKGKHEDVRRIAEALGVTKVLEGSVRKAGNRIRVMAQLIAAADGTHVWSERYDRELADVFAVQDEIAAAITAALRLTLSPASALPRRYTPSLPAYDQYLKALHLSDATTAQTLVRAREHFERAIALDPQFALAHAEFAHLYHLLAIYGVMAPLEALPSIREHTRRALEIDSSLPEGRAMLGTVAMFDFDWPETERQFRLAMSHGAIAPARASLLRALLFAADRSGTGSRRAVSARVERGPAGSSVPDRDWRFACARREGWRSPTRNCGASCGSTRPSGFRISSWA